MVTNPYIQKIIQINKDIDGLKLDRAVLVYDLDELKRMPVPTIPIFDILEKIDTIDKMINDEQLKILKITKFLI